MKKSSTVQINGNMIFKGHKLDGKNDSNVTTNAKCRTKSLNRVFR